MESLNKLNPQQRMAVLHTDGPLLILAGAGSGKTGVIAHRIAHLINRREIPAQSILAVSFTNKAADELRTRGFKLLPGKLSRGLTVCTFHSLAVRILRQDIHRIGYKADFTILNASEQLGLLKKAMKEIRIDDRKFKPEWILGNISLAKNALIPPEEYTGQHETDYEIMTEAVYPRYEESLRALNALDFDDLLTLTVRLLSENTTVRDKYRKRYRYIMIDEYQDTNHCQYRLAHLLGGSHQNLCVVGDDDQSIYSWRGGRSKTYCDSRATSRRQKNNAGTELPFDPANSSGRERRHPE